MAYLIGNEVAEIKHQIKYLESRMTGESTRLVDHYVQELYKNQGNWVMIHDHFKTSQANRILFEKVVKRMQNEHPGDAIEYDRSKCAIKLCKSERDFITEKINELKAKLL